MRAVLTKNTNKLQLDDICVELLISLLEASTDPKEIQIQMTGFLEESTFKFMKNLWELLLSAQKSVGGIPQVFLDAKKEEIRKQRVWYYLLSIFSPDYCNCRKKKQLS